MGKVIINFRDNKYEIIDETEVQTILDMYAKYTKTRMGELIEINGNYRNTNQIIGIEDYKEPNQDEQSLSIIESMRKSVKEENDDQTKTMKEAQLKIFQHNRRCLAERKMQDYIYYKLEGGKLFKIKKEEAEKRLIDFKKQQLLNITSVSEVVEKQGDLAVVLR